MGLAEAKSEVILIHLRHALSAARELMEFNDDITGNIRLEAAFFDLRDTLREHLRVYHDVKKGKESSLWDLEWSRKSLPKEGNRKG
jgi:hypothetical protein